MAEGVKIAYDDCMIAQEFFTNKKVTVMRIGLLGRGIGDAAYIAEAGAEVTVVDAAPAEVMQPAVEQLQHYSNIIWKFGPYDFADFKEADLVLVGAGTPLQEPVLQQCKKVGIPLKQSAALFAELSDIPVIGVTGTRGKSMVTHMIHHVLSHITGEHIILGGNVRGVSNLQLLKAVHEDALAVMELDSWQLQGWGWAEMSPQIAVFTNFMPDHLNYYQQEGMSHEEAMAAYFADKANIFRYQEDSATLITTPETFQTAEAYARATAITIGQGVVLADMSVLPEDLLLATPGEHNRLNAALAYEALKAVGLTEDEINEGLASFPGVPGRLEYRGLIGDSERLIGVYNDNNSTTPAATVAGLQALGNADTPHIILIAGGTDKELDAAPLARAIEQYCKTVVLLPGSGTDALATELQQLTPTRVDTLAAAVEAAVATASSGDILLFSPGFASFGLFQNEYDRNDAFIALITEYQEDD